MLELVPIAKWVKIKRILTRLTLCTTELAASAYAKKIKIKSLEVCSRLWPSDQTAAM